MAATSKAVKLKIKKVPNPMTVFPNGLTYRKDALTRTNYFAIKVENAKGKVTYKASSKAKKAGISVTKSGLVTVPKNCGKGTYKIRVFADGTHNYKAKCYYVTVTVRTWGWQMAISQGICRMQPAKRAPQGVPPYCAVSPGEFS